jgi:hypothetical protein
VIVGNTVYNFRQSQESRTLRLVPKTNNFSMPIRHVETRVPIKPVNGCRWSLNKLTEKATGVAGNRTSDRSAKGFTGKSTIYHSNAMGSLKTWHSLLIDLLDSSTPEGIWDNRSVPVIAVEYILPIRRCIQQLTHSRQATHGNTEVDPNTE